MPHRILLAVTGLSPQIVTETVYALALTQTPRWVPDEVQLLTTARGADNARLKLLSHEPGWFARLCADWRLPPIAFDAARIHVVRRADGSELDDIRDDADNLAAADAIVDLVAPSRQRTHGHAGAITRAGNELLPRPQGQICRRLRLHGAGAIG